MYVGAERRVVTECGAGNGVLRTDVEEAGAGNRGIEDWCGGDTTSLKV